MTAGRHPSGATGARLESQLRFTVLGPVRAFRGDTVLPTGSPQQRALLAALLLRGGHTATVEELIDALWGEEPPDQAKATLRTYASRIRKALAPDADVLASESGGYAVRIAAARAELDLDTASSLVTDAEKASAAGDRCRARELYDAALAQWDGEPLAQLPGPYAQSQRVRLGEWRLGLLEHRLDLDLQVGCHAEAVSELTALTAAHPFRERLRELLMLALYRGGRQAEALAVFDDTHRLLTNELGVDPRSELYELRQRILEADSELSLKVEEPAARSGHGSAPRPAQLPATVADFTGRVACVAELGDQLAASEGTVMAVSAVAGIGGVGKTTLAVHVAHAAREHFPDGQLYVDLQGAGPTASEPEAVLGAFLRSLGTPDAEIPDGVTERAALYRSLLAGRRVLTLLDNARDAAQVRPLLPGTAGCAALVTSRARMVDLAGAHLVDLDVMSPEEAMTLFSRIVGAERVAAEREAAMDVVAACGFLPLAIRIAAARLAARRTWTVSNLSAKLADERRRLDELQVGDQAVEATFEVGYSQLDREQARTFRLLGLADGPDISLPAAAALLDRTNEQTEDLLESLVDISLLESAAPGRYRFHDLLRLYARTCAERDEHPPSERDSALSRLLDFYLATATAAYALDQPGERMVEHLAPTATPGLGFVDQAAAVSWLFAESACFLACARQLAHGSHLRRAVDLLMVTIGLAEAGVNLRPYELAAEELKEAAHTAEDTHAEARAHSLLTGLCLTTGRFERADEEARSARLLGLAAQDPVSASYALNDRGIVANYQGRYADAEAYLSEALVAFRDYENRTSEASALCNLARVRMAIGQYDSAISLARQAIEVHQSDDHEMRLANCLYTLGTALAMAGRVPEGLDALSQALLIFHESRQGQWEGTTHFRMAEAHLAAQRPGQAAAHAEQALALRVIGGDWRRATVLLVLGKSLHTLGQKDRAAAIWRDALTVFEQLDRPEADEVRELLTPSVAA
ncbi:AfsR/SARP family transcriptional regulator [Streptomyces oceani]|uniref:Regulator n=1 Tax=Streptomyces oceani TaxID=1075402 RepID=A0A1E7KMH2_9ACTN|nr:BTAD domain-containing putative transcriptional regulator [Streptomyces oceani]OEV05145.1 regulator [Streptomyces oceani]